MGTIVGLVDGGDVAARIRVDGLRIEVIEATAAEGGALPSVLARAPSIVPLFHAGTRQELFGPVHGRVRSEIKPGDPRWATALAQWLGRAPELSHLTFTVVQAEDSK